MKVLLEVTFQEVRDEDEADDEKDLTYLKQALEDMDITVVSAVQQ